MKQIFLGGLTHRAIAPLWRPFLRGASAIFMLHRFEHRHLGDNAYAHDLDQLRGYLAFLRREGHPIVSLGTLLDSFDRGEPIERSVVFTVDDGYDDFLHVGLPIFAEFDAPVTLFATTGFIDRDCWFWWDQIEYLFRTTRRKSARVDLAGDVLSYAWTDAAERDEARWDLGHRLKRVSEVAKCAAIDSLAESLDVEIPHEAPEWCAPMTWDEIRGCVSRGVEVGPHTVTHPILSRVDTERAATEIRGSWQRLRAEVPEALPAFCYPNGDPGSFTGRELAMVRELGLRAGLSTYQEYATARMLSRGVDPAAVPGRFSLPRFTYPPSHAHLVQIVSGLERAKETLRRLLPR